METTAVDTNYQAMQWALTGESELDFLEALPTLEGSDWETMVTWFTMSGMRLEAKIKKYAAINKRQANPAITGQIKYWKNQVSTFKWLVTLLLTANE